MSNEKTPLLKGIIINIPLSEKEINNNVVEIDKTYYGLSLEELLKYENDPWWQNIRRSIFILYWIILFFIFSLACILIILQNDLCSVKSVIVTSVSETTQTTTTTNTTGIIKVATEAIQATLSSAINFKNTIGVRNLSI